MFDPQGLDFAVAAAAVELLSDRRPGDTLNQESMLQSEWMAEFRIGEKVKLRSTGEVGVICWVWKDEHGDEECYVAFFGNEFPKAVPKGKPGILRYYSSSLERINGR